MVKMVFVEIQLSKGMENYFTDSLLYRESHEVVKEPSSTAYDSGDEADSKSEVVLSNDPIVIHLNGDPPCNNDSADDDGEWVLNEDVTFEYSLCFHDVLRSSSLASLHVPLPTSMKACTYIEDRDGAVFVVPAYKKDQSPIIFGRKHPQISTPIESDKELNPP